eukprot:1050350-Prorocentrum_minimum.AAC.2
MPHPGGKRPRLRPREGPFKRLITVLLWTLAFHEGAREKTVAAANTALQRPAKTPAAKNPSSGRSKESGRAAAAAAGGGENNSVTLQGAVYEAANHMPLPKALAHVGILPPYGSAISRFGLIYFGDAAKHRVQV